MARNKNSTALFDVIHAAKKPPRSSPSASISAPRWFGKDKKVPTPPTADPTENVGKQRSWLTAAKLNATVSPAGTAASLPAVPPSDSPIEASSAIPTESVVESAQVPMEAFEPVVDPVAAEPQSASSPVLPKPRFIDRFKSRSQKPAATVEPSIEPEAAAESYQAEESRESTPLPLPVFYTEAEPSTEEPAAVKSDQKPQKRMPRDNRNALLAVDRAGREIRLNLSFGGMVAIGFIFLMALAIAFVAGTHMQIASGDASNSDPRLTAGLPSTAGLEAAVIAVKPADPEPGNRPDRPVHPDVLNVSSKMPKPAPGPGAGSVPSPLRITGTREIGLMYIVIQSYPDQDLAQKACDFVNHQGVPCTMVAGLTHWAPRDWYSVVGVKPYKKHDPALEEDEKAIALLGEKFSSKVLNQFQPQGYTWRTDSEESAQ